MIYGLTKQQCWKCVLIGIGVGTITALLILMFNEYLHWVR